MKNVKILFSLLLILFFFVSCSNLEKIEVTNEQGVVTEVYSRNKENFAKEGLYKAFSDTGTLLEEATYRNDTLEGERKIYFENGKVQAIEMYQKGLFDGQWKGFYEDGNLELEGNYVNNEMSGLWKRFYKDGKIMEEVFFKNNEEEGPFKEFYPNGNIKAEGNYLGGDYEDGELKLYLENGELERIMDCKMGRCETRWAKEENPADKNAELE